MSIEDNLQSMFLHNAEKTSIDKILAKEDIKSIRELLKKEQLGREDMLEILDFLVSAEAKLVNYDDWGRYIILKFFVWVREFVKCAELIFDSEADLEKFASLDPDTKLLFQQCKRISSHNIKFLVDLYLNIARTSLSLHASGFVELLKNKFELYYPHAAMQSPQEKPNFLGFRK